MSSDSAVEKCAECGKVESDHDDVGDIQWIGCFLCGDKGADLCLGEKCTGAPLWSCRRCQKVMRRMRGIVNDWDEVKKNLGGSDESGKNSRKEKDRIDDLEREVRLWRKKMSDRNYEMTKLQKQLRQVEDKANMRSSADGEVRFLRQQLTQLQQGSSGGAGSTRGSNTPTGGMGSYGGGASLYGSNSFAGPSGWQQNSTIDQGRDFGSNALNLGDNGYGKRAASYDSLSSPPAKKSMSDVSILFVVDNVMRGFVMNQRLQHEFWRRKWEVRLRRGASSEAIMEAGIAALQQNLEEGHRPYDHVVICGGAVDLESLTRADEHACDRIRANLVSNLHKLAAAAVQSEASVWIIAPPPRKNCIPWERQSCIRELENTIASLNGKAQLIRLEEDLDDSSFIQMRLYDGIHVQHQWEVPVLELILLNMGLDARIPYDDLFSKEEIFGYECCWRCGGEHKRTVTPCRDFSFCSRCGDKSHHEDVCLYKYKMCTTCGERGHGPDKCTVRSERY